MLKCAYQQNLFPSLKMSPVTNTNQLARKFRFISVVLRSSPEHLCLLRRLASANGPHLRTQPVPSRDSVSLAPSEGEKLGMCYLKVLHLQLPHCRYSSVIRSSILTKRHSISEKQNLKAM